MIDVRAWLASAAWACLCGVSAMVFLTVTIVGLFLLFFGALISAILAPFLAMMPADWQWTGGQWIAVACAVWFANVLLFGALARWGYRRCRAVVFALPSPSWARGSSVITGAIAAFVLVGTVPSLVHPWVPSVPPIEPARDEPLTV